MQRYKEEKKPLMPSSYSLINVLPLKVLCHQAVLLCRSKECDFLAATLTSNNIFDFNGSNTLEARMAGQSTKPKTNVFCRPLIDKTPSDPSTVLTAMTDTEQICNAAGQDFTILASDQQLYRVMVDITWSNPTRWQLLIPRIGGMHWLMNFVDCVRKLMEGSGLNKSMASAFSGFEKSLIGEKFPVTVRPLGLVIIELLRGFIDDSQENKNITKFYFFLI